MIAPPTPIKIKRLDTKLNDSFELNPMVKLYSDVAETYQDLEKQAMKDKNYMSDLKNLCSEISLDSFYNKAVEEIQLYEDKKIMDEINKYSEVPIFKIETSPTLAWTAPPVAPLSATSFTSWSACNKQDMNNNQIKQDIVRVNLYALKDILLSLNQSIDGLNLNNQNITKAKILENINQNLDLMKDLTSLLKNI